MWCQNLWFCSYAASVLDKNKNTITANPQGRTANPFDFGVGLLIPMKVENPGLVYDVGPTDYMNFLYGFGYDDSSLSLVTGDMHKFYSNTFQYQLSFHINLRIQWQQFSRPNSDKCRKCK